MNKQSKIILLLPLILFAFAGCVGRYSVKGLDKEPVIRVLIAENVPTVQIQATGGHTLSSPAGSMPLLSPGEWSICNPSSLSVVLNGSRHLTKPGFPLKIAPDEKTILKLEGRPYRGWLAVTPGTSSGFNVINLLPLESYLYGVVPREIGKGSVDIMAALEAQAICARSYAISRTGAHRSQGFDIYADTRDQVYAGMSVESRWCNQAVEETRGKVAFAADELLDARYHSTCGGRTANSEDVWSAAIPYLRSVRDRPWFLAKPYCASSPHFEWEKLVPASQFYATLSRMIPSGAKIRSWSLDINRDSKRVVKMVVKSSKGTHQIKGLILRSAFGLKSTYFTIEERGEHMVFTGHGWGHGVGMCQYGAMEMARRGRSAKRILKHYYQDVWVGRLYR